MLYFIDCETTGLDLYGSDKIFLLQIGKIVDGELKVDLFPLEPFGHITNPKTGERKLCEPISYNEKLELRAFLKSIFEDRTAVVVGHNLKFDLHAIFQYFSFNEFKNSSYLKCTLFDTMTFFKICNNTVQKTSLKEACEFYGVAEKDDGVARWIEENKRIFKGYDYVDYEIMLKYAKQDIVSTYELYMAIQNHIKKFIDDEIVQKKEFLDYLKLEMEVTKTLFFMERRGISVDLNYVNKAKDAILNKLVDYELEFYKDFGEFFIDSAQNIQKYYEKIGIELTDKLETGNLNISKAVLSKYDCKLTNMIIEIRELKKQLSTYIDNILNLQRGGKIRTNFIQCGADTLRMASRNPNLQNIPTEDGEYSLRSCFCAEKGYLYSVDFAAQEARIALLIGNEKELINRVVYENLDLHQHNADIMRTTRKNAKGVFFGFLYGSGAAVIAKGLGISIDEAQKIKANLRNALPNLSRYTYLLNQSVEENGYLCTLFGNPLFIDKKFAYKALNYKIQGSCAVITKRALVAWDKVANKYDDGYPLLVIHDEIIAEFYQEPSEEMKKEFIKCFQDSYELMDAEFSAPMKNWRKQ